MIAHYLGNTVGSFLSEGHMTVKFDDKIGKDHHITIEILLGSPFSHIFFCTYHKLLPDKINESKCFLILYVDDIKLLFLTAKKKSLYIAANRMLAGLAQATLSLTIS